MGEYIDLHHLRRPRLLLKRQINEDAFCLNRRHRLVASVCVSIYIYLYQYIFIYLYISIPFVRTQYIVYTLQY